MRTGSRLLLLTSLLGVVACGEDTRQATDPAGRAPSGDLVDGRNGGNPLFFFLPPVGPSPDAFITPGAFSAAWQPVAEVCSIGAQGQPCDGNYLVTLAPATVDPALEQYTVSWTPVGGVVPVGLYRLAIYLDLPVTPGTAAPLEKRLLGFRDIEINQRSEGETPGTVLLQPDRTLPVKFRLERGLATGGSSDLENVVTNDGGAFKCVSSQCGFYFPPGWLANSGLSQVTFIVQRTAKVDGACISDGAIAGLNQYFQQFEGCFKAFTIPDMGTTAQNITFGMCSELAEGSYPIEALSPFKYNEETGVLRELKNATPLYPDPVTGAALPLFDIETCPSFAAAERRGPEGMLWGGARALASRVGAFFAPREAWAVDLGLGGQIGFAFGDEDSFSTLFWGVPHRVDISSGNGQTGDVGAVLPAAIAVQVTGTHTHDDLDVSQLIALDKPGEQALSGIPVTFTVTGGLGGVGALAQTSVVVLTDANGIASTPWTLGIDVGANTVSATIPDDPGRFNRRKSVEFTATGISQTNSRNQIRVQSPAIKDQESNNVYLTVGDVRPFNAKLYQSGLGQSATCVWPASSVYLGIVVPGTDPGAVSITALSATPLNNKGVRTSTGVQIQCGTVKRTLNFFVSP